MYEPVSQFMVANILLYIHIIYILFAWKVCICIGEIILNECPGATLTEYNPLYLQKNSNSQVHNYSQVNVIYINFYW